MQRFSPVFEALNRAGGRYVVVGGVAVNLYGYVRGTTDIDVVIDLAPEDARRSLLALSELGYRPKVPVKAEDFADPGKRESWIREKGMVVFSLFSDRTRLTIDIFVAYPVPFDELWTRTEVVTLRDGSVRIASLEDLLAIKRSAGRPKDLLDVAELERLHHSEGEGEK
jgi:hypothetical protein